MATLTPTTPGNALSTNLQALLSEAQELAATRLARATRKNYASDWKHFSAWCLSNQLAPLPAEVATVIAYVTELAQTTKASTLRLRLISIRTYHKDAGLADPTRDSNVENVMKGIRKKLGTAQRKSAPLLADPLKAMLATLDLATLQGLRDRALLLVGFAAALRRSELVAIQREDLSFSSGGLTLTIRKSKTDQEGAGHQLAIHRGQAEWCPIAALQTWLSVSGIASGPVFRSINKGGHLGNGLSGQSVALIVKKLAEAANIGDPGEFSGHSLRSGMVTQAIVNGCAALDVMEVSRHKSAAVFSGYVQRARVNAFSNQTTARLGL